MIGARSNLHLLAVTAVLAAALISPGPVAAGGGGKDRAPVRQPDAEGRWITDGRGRVAILHGVNLAIKRDGATALDAGFGRDDVRFLVRSGFNTVRLTLNWASVEPRPGVFDDEYLDQIATVYRMLADAGIYVMLDMHQDMWGRRYGGNGHPEWSNIDGGLPPEPDLGFPLNYLAMPALWQAFDSFWANRAPDASPSRGLQDHYAAMWRKVAARFAGDSRLLGYDLMNEPWPGTAWPVCTAVGCPSSDPDLAPLLEPAYDPALDPPLAADRRLARFHQRVADAIRGVDRRSIVWYEPFAVSALGARTAHPPLADRRTGFSFHNYCILGAGTTQNPDLASDEACRGRERQVFERMVREHQEQADPRSALMLSEFGATNHVPEIARVADLADEYMVSWQYWFYCLHCQFLTDSRAGESAADGPALVMDMRRAPKGANVDRAKLDTLVRPFPRLVSGTPLAYGFDPQARRFTLRFSTARSDGKGTFARGSRTEVFVPKRHYPHGYRVKARGARAVRKARGRRLVLRKVKGAKQISVVVEARGDRRR